MKKKPKRVQKRPKLIGIVAIHKGVQASLADWAKGDYRPTATKVVNLVKAAVKNDLETERAIKRQLAVTPINRVSGLNELGPKQQKGGAPRVFVLRDFDSSFFVIAGVEKGSKGVKINEACRRASHIKNIFSKLDREEAIASIEGDYTVIEVEERR